MHHQQQRKNVSSLVRSESAKHANLSHLGEMGSRKPPAQPTVPTYISVQQLAGKPISGRLNLYGQIF